VIKRGTSSALKLGNDTEAAGEAYLELEQLLLQVEQAATHYEVFGLSRSATPDQLRRAHQQAVTLLHPSHYAANLVVNDKTLLRVDSALNRVAEAFSVLTEVAERIKYDAALDCRPTCERLAICIAASVTGYEQQEGKWHEIARTVEVSQARVSLRMRRRVARGCVLHVTLPMPVELRLHSHADPSYSMFAIVRNVEFVTDSFIEGGSLVDLEFLGRRPPVGYLSKPWMIFNISSPTD
jgi:hypothetical protein